MIRNLAMIALAGFVLCVACLSAAFAIGGPDALARSAWSWGGDYWNFGWSTDHGSDARHDEATRELAWTGGEALTADIPAEITYVQADGPARMTVSGPRDAVNAVAVKDGTLVFDRGATDVSDLKVTLTAPNVSRFALHGSDQLTLKDYDQPSLALDLSGEAQVDGDGQAKAVKVDISGSANADLSDIKTSSADVRISGSGEAKVAPTESAKVDISGSGEVYLETHPAHLDTQISGSGQLHQGDDD